MIGPCARSVCTVGSLYVMTVILAGACSPIPAPVRVLQDVKPSPEQLPILTDTGPGFRLIRGAAGSGKTTAALMRLQQLCSARLARRRRLGAADPIRVLVLTFNRTLSGYVEHLAAEQIGTPEDVLLEIETFGKWAIGLCGYRDVVDDDRRLRGLLATAGFLRNLDYFVAEVQYILGRWQPTDRHEYLGAERFGRGRAPAVPRPLRSRLLTDVIAPYKQQNEELGKVDWSDVALEAARAPSEGYDVVVADEAQDLSANQIRAITAHLAEDHTTTFIVDAVQRIYPQAFRWREVGIEIRPNHVYPLKRNHRNTVAIARLAAIARSRHAR